MLAVDMSATLTLSAISLCEPFATHIELLNKTEESRNGSMLASHAGELMLIRRGRLPWTGAECILPPVDSSPDGLVSAVVRLGATRSKVALAEQIGELGVSASVGLEFSHVGRYCTEITAVFPLPMPHLSDAGNGCCLGSPYCVHGTDR